jgi:hypothetical protein
METNRALQMALIGGALILTLSGGEGRKGEQVSSPAHAEQVSPRTLVIPIGNTNDASSEAPSFDEIGPDAADSIIKVGIRNAARLLPLAKRFTVEALHRTAVSVGLGELDLREAEEQINAIDSIVLDEGLYDWAEVDLNQPSVIRVGIVYAFYLSTNEEAIFLLGHELTHVAAWSSNIDRLMDSISAWSARVSTSSNGAAKRSPSDMKEDLACDFIGAQALKLYMFHYPSIEPIDERITWRSGRPPVEGPTTAHSTAAEPTARKAA